MPWLLALQGHKQSLYWNCRTIKLLFRERISTTCIIPILRKDKNKKFPKNKFSTHYTDVIMSTMASQITGLTIVCSTFYSCADQRKHQSSVLLAFVRGIYRWPVNSPHKGPVTRKIFHLMMSSWLSLSYWSCKSYQPISTFDNHTHDILSHVSSHVVTHVT